MEFVAPPNDFRSQPDRLALENSPTLIIFISERVENEVKTSTAKTLTLMIKIFFDLISMNTRQIFNK